MCQQIAPGSPRTCVICKKPLVGRSDKVFCDIKCKNYYHSQARQSQRTANSETNAVLAKNYIILAGLMNNQSEKLLISKLALLRAGFNFQYVTEVIHLNGIVKFGIYDITYQLDRKGRIIIEVDQNRSPISPFVFERWSRVFTPSIEHLIDDNLTGVAVT